MQMLVLPKTQSAAFKSVTADLTLTPDNLPSRPDRAEIFSLVPFTITLMTLMPDSTCGTPILPIMTSQLSDSVR